MNKKKKENFKLIAISFLNYGVVLLARYFSSKIGNMELRNMYIVSQIIGLLLLIGFQLLNFISDDEKDVKWRSIGIKWVTTINVLMIIFVIITIVYTKLNYN